MVSPEELWAPVWAQIARSREQFYTYQLPIFRVPSLNHITVLKQGHYAIETESGVQTTDDIKGAQIVQIDQSENQRFWLILGRFAPPDSLLTPDTTTIPLFDPNGLQPRLTMRTDGYPPCHYNDDVPITSLELTEYNLTVPYRQDDVRRNVSDLIVPVSTGMTRHQNQNFLHINGFIPDLGHRT